MGRAKSRAKETKEQPSNEPKVAVLDRDWMLATLPDNLTSASNGWLCLLGSVKSCNIFTKKNLFVTHMKKEHNLVPDFSGIRGRPKLGLRKRAPLSV
jgi:hypothetical protein